MITNEEIQKQFWADFDAVREKYPMVYWDVWTPDDFVNGADGSDRPVDWTNACHIQTVQNMEDSHDANSGVNWYFIEECRQEQEEAS